MPKKPAESSPPTGRLNDPPLLILTSLASGEKHGYALMQDIAAFARVQLGPGTLYGAISRLEERGLIEAVGDDGRRRPYRLTPAGSASLQDALAELRAIVDEGAARLARRGVRVGSTVRLQGAQ
jgi:DNA-binding PadR family transcriptional regulator